MKTNLIYSIITHFIEGLFFLFLSFGLVDVLVQDNLYLYHFESISGYDVLKGNLSVFHQVLMIVCVVATSFIILMYLYSMILKKPSIKTKKIFLFMQIMSSFCLLSHYNFLGFIFEILLFVPVILLLIQQSQSQKEKNGNLMFINTIYGVILMFFLILILSLDAFIFTIF